MMREVIVRGGLRRCGQYFMLVSMRAKSLCIVLVFSLSGITVPAADNPSTSLPFVSPMFGDNMVLQRGKPNTIWGWAKPGEEVRVEIADHTAKTVTGTGGRWQVQIEPPAPGGPYTLKIDGPQAVEFHEVLVGDVWLCGGQSNMQLGLGLTRNGDDEIKSANHPEIRLYTVSQHVLCEGGGPTRRVEDMFASNGRRRRRILGRCLFLWAQSAGGRSCTNRAD